MNFASTSTSILNLTISQEREFDAKFNGIPCARKYCLFSHRSLLYADDIILLSHSLNAMRAMLKICEQFALDFDVKFNAMKSVVMRIGEW